VAGGIKIHKTRTFTISHSVISSNLATGLWMDQSNYDAWLYDNTVSGNTGHGIFYEISSKAVIANNIVQGNAEDGLKINDSDQVRIWNNKVVSNGRNMEIVQDSRIATNLSIMGHDPRRPMPDPTMTWLLDNVEVMNNLIGGAGDYDIYARDYTGSRTAAQMHITIDGNIFSAPASSANANLVWGTSGTSVTVCRSTADISKVGAGSNNLQVASTADLKSQGMASGSSLPADIAVLTGAAPSVGYAGPF
jgi:parallel beta-helix repeat protein